MTLCALCGFILHVLFQDSSSAPMHHLAEWVLVLPIQNSEEPENYRNVAPKRTPKISRQTGALINPPCTSRETRPSSEPPAYVSNVPTPLSSILPVFFLSRAITISFQFFQVFFQIGVVVFPIQQAYQNDSMVQHRIDKPHFIVPDVQPELQVQTSLQSLNNIILIFYFAFLDGDCQ